MKVLLIPGHGGVNPKTKEYVTPGKRSPLWPDGTQLFEGVFNRTVVWHLQKMCMDNGITALNLVPEWQDIILDERVERVKNEVKKGGVDFMLEIHANAATSPQANGFEFFTNTGITPADHIADVMIEEYSETIPSIRLRTDNEKGFKGKNRDFYVIRNTEIACPSVLIECAFMTNKKECDLMLKKPELFAEAIYKGIVAVKGKFK